MLHIYTSPYKDMYIRLFNEITETLKEIHNIRQALNADNKDRSMTSCLDCRTARMQKRLIKAQRATENMFITGRKDKRVLITTRLKIYRRA